MSFAEWNQGLLLSVVLVVAGGMLLVRAVSRRERLLAIGTLSQGIVFALATQGAFHGRSDLSLAAIAMASLCLLWSVLVGDTPPTSDSSRHRSLPRTPDQPVDLREQP